MEADGTATRRNFDQLEPEPHDPAQHLLQGGSIWQFDAKGGRLPAYADLAVVELGTQYLSQLDLRR